MHNQTTLEPCLGHRVVQDLRGAVGGSHLEDDARSWTAALDSGNRNVKGSVLGFFSSLMPLK